jgi:hypothetical protein
MSIETFGSSFDGGQGHPWHGTINRIVITRSDEGINNGVEKSRALDTMTRIL